MSVNNIRKIVNLLEDIELESIFEKDLEETGIFEQILSEDSSLIKYFQQEFPNDPEAIALAKYLHQKQDVSSRARIVPYENVSGQLELQLFKSHYDNFRIFKGPNGWAATRPEPNELRRKLETDPKYQPSKDQKLRYIAVYSLKTENSIVKDIIIATRGGRYSRKEKPGVSTVPITDQLFQRIGGPRGVKVWELMDRDEPGLKDLPEPRFSGQRSRELGTPGASVERRKKDVRRQLTKDPSEGELLEKLSKKLIKIIPIILKFVDIKRRRLALPNSPSIRKLLAFKTPESLLGNLNKSSWNKIVNSAAKSLYSDDMIKNLKSALSNQKEVLMPIINKIKENLADKDNGETLIKSLLKTEVKENINEAKVTTNAPEEVLSISDLSPISSKQKSKKQDQSQDQEDKKKDQSEEELGSEEKDSEDEMDDLESKISDSLEKAQDSQSNNQDQDLNKPNQNQGDTRSETGKKDLKQTSKWWENAVPKFDWKSLIKKLIGVTSSSSLSYTKPSSRIATQVGIAQQLGSTAVKPGERKDVETFKMALVFDTSGSMYSSIPMVLSEAFSLIKKLKGDIDSNILLIYFSQDVQLFSANIKSYKYQEINNVNEINKTIGPNGKNMQELIDNPIQGTYEVYGPQLIGALQSATSKGFNVMIFSDNGVTYGGSWDNFSEFYKNNMNKTFFIANSDYSFREICKKLGSIPNNFSHF